MKEQPLDFKPRRLPARAASEYRQQLRLRLEAGTPFGDIEDWIEALPVLDDAKAGLWLLAWAEQARPAQRAIAEQALAAVES